ncbi:TOMM precursor leader peptide-binding protein [Streptomyces sp. NPDC097619]|uniref:TOMM precursor leader peptide-binding protein n=1 Tax=Streptomyces sp. NPDC097619 TaxID=3157228 RepID=UPI003324CED9
MTRSTFDAVAATRPRIRRDVLFTQTPDGVLFHNSDGGFRLNAKSAYRFATLIVPHLDGTHTVADLCTGLGEAQRSMVAELVSTLYERDFARAVAEAGPEPDGGLSADVARRYAPQIAYAEHYADGAAARFAAFRSARVAVLGEDETARWAVLSLVRNGCATVGFLPGTDTVEAAAEAAEAGADGCPVELLPLPAGEPTWSALADWDVVVVTGGPAAPARLLPLLREGVPEGKLLLPAWTFGGYGVTGPLSRSGGPACWGCAALRLGSGGTEGAAGAAAGLWNALALPGAPAPGVPVSGPLAAMTGNLLGYEVFRVVSGALPAETDGQVLVQDLDSLDVTAEPLSPHPACPLCGGAAAATAAAGAVEPVDLTAAGASAAPALPTLDTARDADALVEELNRRAVLVRPHTGVFTRYEDEPLTQIPLKVSAVGFGTAPGARRTVAAFDVHHVAGARMRALDAAALVYAEHVAPAPEVVAEAAGAAVAEGLLSASGVAGRPAAWQRGVSLSTKEPVLVPAGAVRPFGPHNAAGLFERTRAGAGAGPSPADAAAAGLLSALSHAALLRAVRGAPAAPVPLPSTEVAGGAEADAELTFLLRSADRLELPVELLDLGEEAHSGAHVLLARSGGRWAVGAALERREAAVAALRDLLGAAQYERDAASGDGPADTGDPLLRDLDPRALAVAGEAAPESGAAGGARGWTEVLERLAAAGRDVLVVRTGPADLAAAGIHTVRVLLASAAGVGESRDGS